MQAEETKSLATTKSSEEDSTPESIEAIVTKSDEEEKVEEEIKNKTFLDSFNLPKISILEETPEWLKDDYLLKGYRINHHRFVDLLKSLFTLHNETINIWTHLIGGICFIVLAVYLAFFSQAARDLTTSLYNKVSESDLTQSVTNFINVDMSMILNNANSNTTEASST